MNSTKEENRHPCIRLLISVKRRKIKRARKNYKQDKLVEKEGASYEPGGY